MTSSKPKKVTLDFLSRNDASSVPKIPQIGVKGVRHDLKTHPRAMKILALTNFGVLSSKMTLIKIFLSYLTHFQSPASSFHSC